MYSKWRYANSDEPRYYCKACAKTFTGLTGPQFSRIHHNGLLLENAACMKDPLSVQAAARELGVNRNTAFRFRHLMKPILSRHQPDYLHGIAEADEMFFRLSLKGAKIGMPRKAFKRGPSVSKRGISTEQVAVLTAVSRGSRNSYITVLPSTHTAASIVAALASFMEPDTALCSDSAKAYKAAANAMGFSVRQIPSGSYHLGPHHIQIVNALYSRIKGWFRPFKGAASNNLPVYLSWPRFLDQTSNAAKPRQFLLDAFGVSTINTV